MRGGQPLCLLRIVTSVRVQNSADPAAPAVGARGMDQPIVDVDVVIGCVDRVPTRSAAAYAAVTPYPQLALDTGRKAFRATGDNPGVAVLHSSRGRWVRRPQFRMASTAIYAVDRETNIGARP